MRAETNNVIYSQLMFSCLIDYFGQKMVKKNVDLFHPSEERNQKLLTVNKLTYILL